MDLVKCKFIKLNDNKVPTHKLSTYFDYNEVQNEKNLGILIDEPFIVIDVDDTRESELLYQYVNIYNIKCSVMETIRGKHFWFKTYKSYPNYIGVQNPLSIKCDIRSFGKKCFVMVKKDGVWREWLNNYNTDEIDEIPKEILPLNDKLLNSKTRLSLITKVGEGRRNGLFDRIIPLANDGWSERELKELFIKMNLLFFNPPLDHKEIENMFTDDHIFDQTNAFFGEGGKFLHHKFSLQLHRVNNGLFVKGSYYFWDDENKIYSKDVRILHSKMNSVILNLKQTQRNEVYNYLITLPNSTVVESDHIVNVNNGLVNLKNDEFFDFDKRYFLTNKLNVKYDKNAVDANVNKFLDDITCKNTELRNVLEEMLGYCFVSNTIFQKAFILKGYGSNGKSTLLDVIRNIFGLENISSVGIEELIERFKRASLVDKMVNISAEIPETSLKNLHIFKKLVTGDVIDAEFKGKDSFNFVNTAKFIFSANELPKMNDTTEGFSRRIIVIPFNRYFSDEEKDINMLSKLTTEEAKSYWLNLAIKGYQRLVCNKGFSKCELIDKEINNWMNSANSIRRWFSTIKNKHDTFNNKTLEIIHQQYMNYCIKYNNGRHSSIWKLKEELLINFKNIEINDDNLIIFKKF